MSDEQDKQDKPASASGADVVKWAGVGVGIGSAALVAALLYYNRDRVAKVVARKAPPIDHED